MDNLLTVAFEAHHSEKNHHRRYQVTIGRDLFDAWTVSVRYSRIGQEGHRKHFASSNPEEMRQVVSERLRRRLTATRRIGCPYRLTEINAAPGFDADDWLPGDLMARFLPVS